MSTQAPIDFRRTLKDRQWHTSDCAVWKRLYAPRNGSGMVEVNGKLVPSAFDAGYEGCYRALVTNKDRDWPVAGIYHSCAGNSRQVNDNIR